jgi:hypothetical protein
MTNLYAHIFTTTSKFHGTTISNNDLEVIDFMDIEKGLLNNSMMNKIMGVSIVNEDIDFPMLEISN